MFTLYNGDCLDVMATLPDKSIDFICCDLPYGATNFEWDVIIPFEKLWAQYERLITDTGSIALFASGLFLPKVLLSNQKLYRYMWVWEKDTATFFLHAHNRPMSMCEFIVMFSKGVPNHATVAKNRMLYNPQGLTAQLVKPRTYKPRHMTGFISPNSKILKKYYKQTLAGYPTDVLHFKKPKNSVAVHPTEKPVDLLMYLVKTYTNKGMTVLDNCMGSGSCGEACIRTGRNFIGIEKDKEYFDVAENRLKNLKWQGGLFDNVDNG